MLPIALRPDGRRALIVGGGAVALRKAESLQAAGLLLRVVALQIDPALRALVEHQGGDAMERAFRSDDFEGVLLAIAATNDDAVNEHIVHSARERGILVCDASLPERGDFTMQATVRVGELTFTVDSGGSTPAFSKRIARELQEHFGDDYDAAARTLARMRTYVKAVVPESERAAVLRTLAERPVEELASMNPIAAEHEVEHTVEELRAHVAPLTSALVCASRASALAMTQTKTVAARLAERGLATTILNVTTTGDRVQDRPLVEVGVNVFVKELELALRERRADYAVHSCKDLPSELPQDMCIAAISVREDPRDAFCSERFASFEALPAGALVGTSSPRRRMQLEALRPDLQFKDIRGNVDTRLRKLRDGEYDAIVIAMAGLNRLHQRATHTVPFDAQMLVPAVAQGALAIETRIEDDALAARVYEALNDRTTELAVRCERAALRTLRAGCNAPIGVHARFDGDELLVDGAYALPGGTVLRERERGHATENAQAEHLGVAIAERLLAKLHGFVDPLPALHGRLIVLARTREEPSAIAAALRERGADVVELGPNENEAGLERRTPDMLLFPSSASVGVASRYLATLRSAQTRPLVAAMGPHSAAAATDAGFAPDAVATEATIDAFVELISERLKTT